MRLRHIASGALRAVKNEPVVRRVIARSEKPDSGPKDWFAGIDDETWFWINTAGRRRRKSVARLVPAMPEVSMQESFTGQSGDSTLREGFNAYRIFKRCYETHVGPIRDCRAALDFGCGWGRIIRFFLKDLPPERLLGIDHSEEAVRVCQNTNKWCRFILIDPHAPTPLPKESFDLIYLYSVFSHLPEEMHWAWLKEFHRLLAPGGMLVATTRPRNFIELKVYTTTFQDVDAALAVYDNGQFCYESHGMNGRWSFWGEACIPKSYVEKRWPELFDVCDYIDDRDACVQNVIVARKRT